MPLRLLLAIGFLLGPFVYAGSVTIAYTANRQGEIKPCGCKIREIGGLSRMEARVAQLKSSGAVIFVDSGNTFFKMPKISTRRLEEAKKQAELIAEGYKRMGLKALSPGERDFGGGTALFWQLLKKTGAIALSANLESLAGEGRFTPYYIWEEGGIRLALTGLTSFDSATAPEHIRVKDPKVAMREVWKIVQEAKPQQIILLSHLGARTDEEIAQEFPGVWIIGSKSMDYYESPKKIAQSHLFEVGIEGQRLGEVSIEKDKRGWQSAKLTELGEEFDNEPKKSRVKK